MNRIKERSSNFELLRIVSMLMILSGHFAYHGGFLRAPYYTLTVNHAFLRFTEICGGLGVALFTMISGWFLITAESVKPKKVVMLWLQLAFYSVGAFLLMVALGREDISAFSHAYHLRPLAQKTWWFATCYLPLYIIHPYLNAGLRALSKRQYRSMLIVVITLWGVLPTIVRRDYGGSDFVWLCCVYALAGYMRLHCSDIKLSAGALFAIAGVCHAATFAMVLLMDNAVLAGEMAGLGIYFTGFHEMPSIVTAAVLFMAFSRLRMKSSRLINLVASATFGVYLIHDHPSIRAWLFSPDMANAGAYEFATNLIPHALGWIFGIFAVCTVIELLRRWTLESAVSALWDAAEKALRRLRSASRQD